MALSHQEICEQLTKLDEVTILEVLEITSKELVEKFEDKIEKNIEDLSLGLEDSQQDDMFNDS